MPTDTFGYTGSVQTWSVPSEAQEATFTVHGPGGGGAVSGETGGDGGKIVATVDVSNMSSVDLYVAQGGGAGSDSYGGWGRVNGEDGTIDAGGGGGMSAVVDPSNGDDLIRSGGGGGSADTTFDDPGGDGADSEVGGAGGDSGSASGGDGTSAAMSGVTIVSQTDGGGASGGGDETVGSNGEIVIDYTTSQPVTVTSTLATSTTSTFIPTVIGRSPITLTAPQISASSSAPAPTLRGGTRAVAPTVSASATSAAPLIRNDTRPIAPAATASTASAPPTIRGGVTTTAGVATASSAAYPPVTIGGAYTALAPTVTASAAASAPPTITAIKSPITTAPAATATTSSPTPLLGFGRDIQATTATSTASAAPAPSIVYGFTSTPPAAQMGVTVPAPGILGTKSPLVKPPDATVSTTTPTPTWRQDQTIPTPTNQTTYIAHSPDFIGERIPTTVTAPGISASTATPVPTITERVPVLLQPESATAQPVAQTPGRVEAVSPIGTLPTVLHSETPTAPTHVRYTQDLSDTIDRADVPDLGPEADNQRRHDLEKKIDGDVTSPFPPKEIASEDAVAYTPERHVYINDVRIGADRDITITASEYGYATASIDLYNLDADIWRNISRNDTVTIELGWRESGVQTVFEGSVVIKRKRYRGRDRGRIIRARGKGADALTTRPQKTYTDMSPHRMVDQLITDTSGISRGYLGTGSERISGSYTLGGGKELQDWLDRIAKKATQQTGERWVWYLENGELSFHPATEQATDHVGFSLEKSVQEAVPAGVVGPQNSHQQYEVLMRCEPIVRRGLSTSIDGGEPEISPDNAYRVASYLHESSTTTGRHHTTATIDPLFKKLDNL